MAQKTVGLTFRTRVEGASSVKDLDTKVASLTRSTRELVTAQGQSESAGKRQLTFIDRLWNRIAQGIPTMITLVGAYKLLRVAIGTVTASLKDLDDELVQQQKFASLVNNFTQFNDRAGKAVTAVENFARSLKVAAEAQNFLQEAAKGTNFVWEELLKGSNEFANSALAKGVGVDQILKLTAAVGKLTQTDEQLESYFSKLNQFIKNPSSRSEITQQLGLSRTQAVELAKAGGQATLVIEKLVPMLQQQAQGATVLQRTWTGLFKELKEGALDALQKGVGPLTDGAKEKFAKLIPGVLRLIETLGPGIRWVIDNLAIPAFKVLVVMMSGLVTAFDLLRGGIDQVNASFAAMSAYVVGLVAFVLSIGGRFATWLGLDGVAGGLEKASAAVTDFKAKLDDIARSKWASGTSVIGTIGERIEALRKSYAGENAPASPDKTKQDDSLERLKGLLSGSTPRNKAPLPAPDTKEWEKAQRIIEQALKFFEKAAADNSLERAMVEARQQLRAVFEVWDKAKPEERKAIIDGFREKIQQLGKTSKDNAEAIAGDLTKIGNAIDRELLQKDLSPLEQELQHLKGVAEAKLVELQDKERQVFQTTLPVDQERALNKVYAERAHLALAWAAATRRATEAERARQQLQAGDARAYVQLNIQDALRDGRPVIDRLVEIQQYVLQSSRQFQMGLALAVTEFIRSLPTEAQAAYNAIKGIAETLDRGLRDSLLSVLKGDTKGLEDALKGVLDSLLRVLADFLADSLEASLKGLLNNNKFIASLFGSNKPGGPSQNTLGIPDVGQGEGVGLGGGDAQGTWRSWLAVGAAGAGLAQSARKGNLSYLSAITSGALAGTAIPGVGNLVGALIGAIVGAGAALVSSINEAKSRKGASFDFTSGQLQVRGYGDEPLSRTELDLLKSKAQKVIDRSQKAWLDIMVEIPRWLFDRIIEQGIPDLSNYDFRQNEGNARVPGQRNIESQNWSKWVDLFLQEELPSAMLETYLPAVNSALEALGYSEDRIRTLNARWRSLGDEVYQEIQQLFAAVVGLQKVVGRGPLDYQDLKFDALFNNGRSQGDTYLDKKDEFERYAKLLNDPSTSLATQLEILNRLNASATEMYESHLAYVQKIVDTQRSLFESIDAQRFGISLDQAKDPNAKKDLLFGRLQYVDMMLQQAQTPEDVARWVAEQQRIIGEIYALDPSKKMAEWADKALADLNTWQTVRLDEIGEAATNIFNEMMDIIREPLETFASLLDQSSGGGESGGGIPDFNKHLDDGTVSIDSFRESLDRATRTLGIINAGAAGGVKTTQEVKVEVEVNGDLADSAIVRAYARKVGQAIHDTGVY